MSRRLRRFLQALLALAALVLLTAACSSDGFPESYADQVSPETGLSNVESNWMAGCEVGLNAVDENGLAEDANGVCACSYAEISGPDGIPFDEFVELNNDLRNNPEALRVAQAGEAPNVLDGNEAKLVDIVKSCIERG